MGDSLADDGPAKRVKLEARPQRFQAQPAVPAGGANPQPQAPSRLLPLSPQRLHPLGEQRQQQHGHQAQAQPLQRPPPPPPPPEQHHNYRDHRLHHQQGQQHQQQHPPLPHHQAHHTQRGHVGALSASIAMAASPLMEDANGCWSGGVSGVFDGSWKWPSSSPMPPQPHMVVAFQPLGNCHFNVFPASIASPAAPLPPSASSGERIRNCPSVVLAKPCVPGWVPPHLDLAAPPIPSHSTSCPPSLTYHLSPTDAHPPRLSFMPRSRPASAIPSTPQPLHRLPLAASLAPCPVSHKPCLSLFASVPTPVSNHLASHHLPSPSGLPPTTKVNPGSSVIIVPPPARPVQQDDSARRSSTDRNPPRSRALFSLFPMPRRTCWSRRSKYIPNTPY